MANELFENYWKFMIENEFQLINEMNNDFICNICNKLMVKACNASCGCKHCSDCIENYVDMKENLYPEKDKYCQIKMINFERDVVIIYQTNRRIAEIIVKCPNKYCEFTDKLSLIENHMKTCDKNETSCPYFEIGCKNDEVMNDEMKDHLCTENYYHTKILDFINNLQNEMESLKNENKNLKKELDKIKIKSKSNQIKNEEMVVIKNENRSLMNKLENIEELRVIFEINEVIERMQRKSEQQTREIDEMKEKCEQTEKKEIEMRRIIDEIFDKIDSDLMKKSNNNYDERINNLQMKIIEIERITEKINFGKFEWKLENFSQQKREKRIYSESFYSHKNGYKMCLSVWIRNDYNYVNVWFHLMRGEFDNDLLWPYKNYSTIDIINQMNGGVYTSKTIKYDDDPNNPVWNKPTTEINDPILFHKIYNNPIHLHYLDNPTEIIRNDQLYIKCKIKI